MSQQRIVLVGGGHAHVQVIKNLHNYARPQHVKVTLIDPQANASYSGMVPGCVAGLYTHAETQLALEPLAAWAGIEFKCTSVEDIEPEARTLSCADGSVVTYDAVSLDIGSMPGGVGDVPGVAEHTIPTRPIAALAARITAAEEGMFALDDAAQAFGASLDGKRLGRWGGAVARSFYPTKTLGCYGDGGAILTDSDEKADLYGSTRTPGPGNQR